MGDPRFLARQLNGEVAGGQVLAPGPGHSAADRSLCVKLVDTAPEGFLVHSFAGDDGRECRDMIREKVGLPPRPARPPGAVTGRGPPVGHYVYRNAEGDPVLRVSRYEPKRFSQSRWSGTCWVAGGISADQRVPYRLADLLEAIGREATVYVAEGEKAADALVAKGLPATCSPGGAGKWPSHFAQWFKGSDVIVLPDNDVAGRKHAAMVLANLAPVASSARIVDLPNLPDKGDSFDWLRSGGDPESIRTLPSPLIPTAERKESPWRSLAALQYKAFAPLAWVVPGYLPQGLTVLAGRPKLGKSWLVLDWALAVARGGSTLGDAKCEAGDVLHAALEDTERRLKFRVGKIVSGRWPERFSYIHDLPKADRGGLDIVRTWLRQADNPRLVVVDTLARVRPGKGRDEGAYDADYAAVTAWKALADVFGVAVVLVHHVRKQGADDPLEMVNGTNGLTGAADTVMVLNRDGQGATLVGRGRDLDEFDRAMRFDRETCRWRVLGDAAEVRRSDERTEVLAELLQAGDDLTPTEIATRLGKRLGATKTLLHRMVKANDLARGDQRGTYRHPDRPPAITPSNPGNRATEEVEAGVG